MFTFQPSNNITHTHTRIRFPSAVGVLFGDEPHPNSVGWFVGGVAMKHAKGFTLIELLIVVAIIGVLAAVGVPMYNGYVTNAKIKAS